MTFHFGLIDWYWLIKDSLSFCYCLVPQLCPTLYDPMNCRMPGFPPSPSPGACSDSCPLSQWCHPTISFSVVPFSSCRLSFLASGSFPMSWLFESSDQSSRASASAFQWVPMNSVFPMNIQAWFPLGFTGWMTLQSKGFSRVFSNTTVKKHQFFSTQPSLWYSSHIHTWLLEKP